MRRGAQGLTLIELLVALAVFGIIFGFLGAFIAQQVRVTGLSQTINETEAVARTVAESVIQDLQLAGSRIALVEGVPRYASAIGVGCTEANRETCVLPIALSGQNVSVAATDATPAGIVVFYRTSVDPGGLCRRVDYAFIPVDSTVLRSDVSIDCPGLTDVSLEISDVDLVRFATDVEVFEVWFQCSDGSTRTRDPRVCYVPDEGFVRQAEVTVAVELTRRDAVRREVTMFASTPNLRPGVDYLRDIPDDEEVP